MRKLNSTNSINEKKITDTCGMAYALRIIGGRWKPAVLWRLMPGRLRYNELKKLLPDVSERVLVLQLRELEQDGLIHRIVHPQVPPKVEYELTEEGASMKDLLQAISDWGDNHKHKAAPPVTTEADTVTLPANAVTLPVVDTALF